MDFFLFVTFHIVVRVSFDQLTTIGIKGVGSLNKANNFYELANIEMCTEMKPYDAMLHGLLLHTH